MNLKKIKEGIKKIVAGKKRVVVIVQCRLSSTRLPRKALLPLGGKTILEWTLASMKKVEASKYFLAVERQQTILFYFMKLRKNLLMNIF